MQLMDWRRGYAIGGGIDGAKGDCMGEVVQRTAAEEPEGARGQVVAYAIDQVETIDQVQQIMNISSDADAGCGLFNASEKTAFIENHSINCFGVYLVASVIVQNSFRQMHDVRFKPEAEKLLRDGNSDRFRRVAGDRFIRGEQTGGEFYAILTIETRTQQEQTDVSAELGASYGFGLSRINADVDFAESLTKLHMDNRLTVRSYQRGGAGPRAAPVHSVQEIIERAHDFPVIVQGEEASIYSVLAVSYDTILTDFAPNYIDIENARIALNMLAQTRNDLTSACNSIDYVLRKPNEFKPFDNATLNRERNVATEGVRQVMQAAHTIANDVSKPPVIPQIQMPDLTKVPLRVDGQPLEAQPPTGHGIDKGALSGRLSQLGTRKVQVFRPYSPAQRLILPP